MHRAPLLLGLLAIASISPSQGWELVSPWGIQQGDRNWMAGRTQDVVEINPNQALVATDGSGVWWVQRNLGVALSREWDSTNILCLAKNPVANGYFAGGIQGGTGNIGVLYQTKPFDRAPLLAPWSKVPLPTGAGPVTRIVTLESPPRIVIATGSGVYWSNIPALNIGRRKLPGGGATGDFSWKAAEGANQGGFWDLEKTPDGVVVSSFMLNPQTGSPIRVGRWQTGTSGPRLVLSNTEMTGTDPNAVGTTSIAVAPSDPRIVYALCCDASGGQLSLNSSEDGGLHWRMRRGRIGAGPSTIRSPEEVGVNGNGRANTIAVSPNNPNTVVFGTTHAYVSTDGGDTLRKAGYTHDDHASFVFSGNRLYDCCDGGVMFSDDLGLTFKHDLNQKLANLQFYPQGFDAFGLGTNAMGGGLQDNEEVVVFWSAGAPGPWQLPQPLRNDGGSVIFLPGGVAFSDGGGEYKWRTRTGTSLGEGTVSLASQGAVEPYASASGTVYLSIPKTYRVFNPSRTNQRGELIIALGFVERGTAAQDHGCQVFGLYRTATRPPHWEPLVNITVPGGQSVSTVASYNGNQIYVGFVGTAQIWKINVADGQKTVQQNLPTDGGYIITEILAPGPNDAYAIRNQYTGVGGQGAVYYLGQGDSWTKASGLPNVALSSLAADSPQQVFVGSDTTIYKMENNRSRWEDISTGLPKAVHPTTMQVVTGADSRKYLYLATYGWSVWRLPLSTN